MQSLHVADMHGRWVPASQNKAVREALWPMGRFPRHACTALVTPVTRASAVQLPPPVRCVSV